MHQPIDYVTGVKAPLFSAIRAIASRCDGAHSLDGVGFDGQDALFGARVAWSTTPDDWSQEMTGEVYRVLRKYKAQLLNYGIDYDALLVPDIQSDTTIHAARDEARAAERKTQRAVKVYLTGDRFLVKGSGTYDKKDIIKAAGASWDPEVKAWSFDRDDAPALLWLIQSPDGNGWLGVDDSAEEALAGVVAVKSDRNATRKIAKVMKSRVALVWKNVTDDEFALLVTEVKDLPGREYLAGKKANVVNLCRETLAYLTRHEFEGVDEVESALIDFEEVLKERERRETLAEAASRAATAEREVALAEHLYEYQKAGVIYVSDHADGQAIIGDEMGLGKTRQAIATLEDRESYPAVVVCPPHLTSTWSNEFAKVNPGRVARVLKGNSVDPSLVIGADVLIIGYSVLASWIKYRIGDPETGEPLLQPRGVVFDESHYAKNPSSARAKAARALSGRVREGGTRICLTGTPVLNRVAEILPQIELIGRWKEFGSKAEFLRTYGGAGIEELNQLNTLLRRTCYVRRLKSEVLKDLPSKSRTSIHIEVDDEWHDTYEDAKNDVIAYLQSLDKDTSRTEDAKKLVMLNVLRKIAGSAKIKPTLEWADSFLNETERSLVIFASHREVQDGIYAGLARLGHDVTRISGSDTDNVVDANKERFQSGQSRVIVCSLKKGGTGHTLTAASDVLIVEQDWTPANLNQAEDRVHRIGQDEAVTATHLVADLGIDVHMRAVIEAKQEICDAVAQGNGSAMAIDDTKVIDEVIRLLTQAEDENEQRGESAA